MLVFGIFLSTLVSSLCLTSVMKSIALKYDIVDRPNTRLKTHSKSTPYLGGGSVLVSFVIGVLISISTKQITISQGFHIAFMSIAIATVGLIDDCRPISWKIRLIAQLLLGVYAYVVGLSIELSSYNWVNLIITAIWITAVINSVNIIDIMDGLAAGVTAVSGLGFGLLGLLHGIDLLVVIGFALCGALLGFLVYNFAPAQIFLGDMGSTLIGLILSIVGIVLVKAQEASIVSLMSSLMLIYVPLFDLTFVFVIRLLNKQSPFMGSPDHFAIRLKNFGFSVIGVTSIAYLIQATFTVLTVLVNAAPGHVWWVIIYGVIATLLFVCGLVRLPKRKPMIERANYDV